MSEQKNATPRVTIFKNKTYPGQCLSTPGGTKHETALYFDWLGRWGTHKTQKNGPGVPTKQKTSTTAPTLAYEPIELFNFETVTQWVSIN